MGALYPEQPVIEIPLNGQLYSLHTLYTQLYIYSLYNGLFILYLMV